jgi:transposase
VRRCSTGQDPARAQDRVKTDRRDAEHLVRLLFAGKLEPVRVPSGAEEAMRDLVRAREDVRGDLMRARHRVSKMLLRHDQRLTAGQQAWSQGHRDWLAKVELGDRVAQLVLRDYLASVEAIVIRRDELERRISELVPQSPWSELVPRLRCLRGIDTLSAVGLCAEVGDFDRFARAGELMSYLGLVPSEHSTGDKRRLGSITKSGSRHARRLLVEAAWHYRLGARPSRELARRQQGQPEHVLAISWKCQQRLGRTWRRLDAERGKRRTLVAGRRRTRAGRLRLGDRQGLSEATARGRGADEHHPLRVPRAFRARRPGCARARIGRCDRPGCNAGVHQDRPAAAAGRRNLDGGLKKLAMREGGCPGT